MNTLSSTFAKKAISTISAFALVATMMPVTAFASESSSAQTASNNVDVISEIHELASGASEGSAAQNAEADTSTSAAEQINQSSMLSENTNAGEQLAIENAVPDNTQASDAPELISGSVNLNQNAESAAAFLNYGGLNFAINSETDNTVSLVGLSTQPGKELIIPSSVESNGTSYTVTEICVGGGSLI